MKNSKHTQERVNLLGLSEPSTKCSVKKVHAETYLSYQMVAQPTGYRRHMREQGTRPQTSLAPHLGHLFRNAALNATTLNFKHTIDLDTYNYIWEDVPMRPGLEATTHRKRLFSIFFPICKGKTQRRNRLQYWVCLKLPNGDIRSEGGAPTLLQQKLLQVASRF